MCTRIAAARGRSLTPPVPVGAPPPPPATRGRRSAAWEHRRAAEAGRVAAMDRFVWTSGLLEINETLVIQQRGVRIYDGEEKVGRRPRRPAGPRAGQGLTLGPGWAAGLGPPLPAAQWTAEPGRGRAEPGTAQFRLAASAPPGTPSPPSRWTGDDLFWAEPGSVSRKDFRRRQQGPAPWGFPFAL